MEDQFSRTELLYGKKAMERLGNARVAVFGVGGVGGFTVEALVRSGIGSIDIIDNDTVSLSNLNRQIIATMDTIGRYKTEVMKERILSINPNCQVHAHTCFYLPETKDAFDFHAYDYVVDAIDTVTGKIQLVLAAQECGTPIISSMGAGNKLHPEMFTIADIYETSVCPLAKVMRRELKKRGVRRLRVVYSTEPPVKPLEDVSDFPVKDCAASGESEFLPAGRRSIPGSTAFSPSVAGLLIASEVINDLTLEFREPEKELFYDA